MSNPPFKSTFASGCQPPVTVTIDGVEVPVVEDAVRTVIRKNGMLSPTRRSEVTIPLEWGDGIPVTAVNGLVGGPNQQQRVKIRLRDPAEEPSQKMYSVIHDGWLRACGPGPKDGTGRLVVGDFSEFLEKTPASMTFSDGDTPADVLAEVRRQFISGQPVADDLEVIGVDSTAPVINPVQEVKDFTDGLSSGHESLLIALFGPLGFTASLADGEVFDTAEVPDSVADAIPEFDQPELSKSFSADRDTLLDVLRWLEGKIGAYAHFAATEGDTPTLVLDKTPTGARFYDADHVTPPDHGQPVDVISNNALFQLNPDYRITARGHSKKSLTAQAHRVLSSGTFPVATAVYEPLRARVESNDADGSFTAPSFEADAVTVREAEHAAKKELKRRLDQSAGGEIELKPCPGMVPFASIRAVPECQHVALVDLPPINYEAEEVIHHIPAPRHDAEPPMTKVRCSLFTDIEKIEIVDSELKDL